MLKHWNRQDNLPERLESSFLEIDDQGFISSSFDQLWDYTYMEQSTEFFALKYFAT